MRGPLAQLDYNWQLWELPRIQRRYDEFALTNVLHPVRRSQLPGRVLKVKIDYTVANLRHHRDLEMRSVRATPVVQF